jgi:8-oxo-dGTP pyrophosphatase MutT (NUDIX family)
MGGVAGNGPDRTVVVILPYREGQVLMQLRDDKEGIAFPGKWGFFGGAVEPGESPEDAARRELAEEIGYHTDRLTPLGSTVIPEVEVLSHAFACSLEVELDELVLGEGMDMAWISLDELMSGAHFSTRRQKNYAVTPLSYLARTFRAMHGAVADSIA